MNALEWHILENSLDEIATMDRLQFESTTISDCCVRACDVALTDAKRAVEWLKIQEAKSEI
jgi:hypothetical protein